MAHAIPRMWTTSSFPISIGSKLLVGSGMTEEVPAIQYSPGGQMRGPLSDKPWMRCRRDMASVLGDVQEMTHIKSAWLTLKLPGQNIIHMIFLAVGYYIPSFITSRTFMLKQCSKSLIPLNPGWFCLGFLYWIITINIIPNK